MLAHIFLFQNMPQHILSFAVLLLQESTVHIRVNYCPISTILAHS